MYLVRLEFVCVQVSRTNIGSVLISTLIKHFKFLKHGSPKAF